MKAEPGAARSPGPWGQATPPGPFCPLYTGVSRQTSLCRLCDCLLYLSRKLSSVAAGALLLLGRLVRSDVYIV